MKILSVLFAISGLFSIFEKGIAEKDWLQVTKIVYCHSDGSIAPPYYRSFTMTVTADSITVTIRDYSRTLAEKRYPNTEQHYKALVAKLKDTGISKGREVKDNSTGGDSESLSLYKDDEEFFKAYKSGNGGNLKLKKNNLERLFKELMTSDLIHVLRNETEI
ncbi:MAG: hypothetical protein K6B13_11490 [Prevotella sp.]|nr:hypothetical protein [Prevotella sp.]